MNPVNESNPVDLEILRLHGDPRVAEVAVARFRGEDRFSLEIVDGLAPPLSREEKWIINVSSQFGCPVGCPFCDAAFSYAGNPSADELLSQVRWALDRHPGASGRCQKLKVHFARMGEPSLNQAVLEALERLPACVQSPGLWACLATVAPRNRDGWFARLAELKRALFRGRFQLQFSVQSTSERDRARLIPVPHWSLSELARFGESFFEPGDRKVVLNFALAKNVDFTPRRIQEHFSPEVFAIKLTPVNPTARGRTLGFQTLLRSQQDEPVRAAGEALQILGYDVVFSVGDAREDEIGSNCGQAVRVERDRAVSIPAAEAAL